MRAGRSGAGKRSPWHRPADRAYDLSMPGSPRPKRLAVSSCWPRSLPTPSRRSAPPTSPASQASTSSRCGGPPASTCACGFRSQTYVVNAVVHVMSDDAYQAIDPALSKGWIDEALARIDAGDPTLAERPVVTGHGVDWHTWVVDG